MSLKGRKNPTAKNPECHPSWCGIDIHSCNNCGKSISKPRILTCSTKCRDAIRSKNGTLKRRIEYNGNIFQSSWEVEIAKFLDDNNVRWSQPKKRLQWFDTTLNKKRTYLPDFLLDNHAVFLDVKNPFKQKQDADKLNQLCNKFTLVVGDIDTIKNYVATMEGLEPPTE